MDFKGMPYLYAGEEHRRYDAIEVRDILFDGPVVSVSPREQAKSIVEMLESNCHNAFPGKFP